MTEEQYKNVISLDKKYQKTIIVEKMAHVNITLKRLKLNKNGEIVMADKSLMEEMLPMKISNWESIEYSEGLNCPNEECDNKSCSFHARNIIGWCDTPYGYMMVCECKKCFTKYRFHGTIDGKFDFENFADNFLMRVEMEKKNYSL